MSKSANGWTKQNKVITAPTTPDNGKLFCGSEPIPAITSCAQYHGSPVELEKGPSYRMEPQPMPCTSDPLAD